MIRFSMLRERYLMDTAGGGRGASPGITRALERIGWRSVGEPSADELAGHLVLMLDSCVHLHRDVHALAYAVASVMRDAGPLLDGGLPPVEAYLPAAEEVLRLYVHPVGTPAVHPFGDLNGHD
jgi:hypothetical protein